VSTNIKIAGEGQRLHIIFGQIVGNREEEDFKAFNLNKDIFICIGQTLFAPERLYQDYL
jgi:hypothetical protein